MEPNAISPPAIRHHQRRRPVHHTPAVCRRLSWITSRAVSGLAPVLVGHRVVGEAGLAVEVGQPRDRASVGADEVEHPEHELSGGLPGPALDPRTHCLLLETVPALDDRVAWLAPDGEQSALPLGVLGHHLGDLRRRAEHLELDVLGSPSPSPRRACLPHLPQLEQQAPHEEQEHADGEDLHGEGDPDQPARRVAALLLVRLLDRVLGVRRFGADRRLVRTDPLDVTTGDHPVRADRGRPRNQNEQQPRGTEDGDDRRRTGAGGGGHSRNVTVGTAEDDHVAVTK